jgi:hypothetical protein
MQERAKVRVVSEAIGWLIMAARVEFRLKIACR